ncbi:hypothetical protein GCM10010236_08690 [Streptomyces eurythermus]|nr:hypothetical protein GCM10010236_08690 [Streptomyces eurythermus]
MRYTAEPGRINGTDREQARPGKPVQASGARAATLQRAVGNAAVTRMIERERDRKGTGRAAVQASGGGEAIRDEPCGRPRRRPGAAAAGCRTVCGAGAFSLADMAGTYGGASS